MSTVTLVCDLESNGLLNEANTIHVLSLMDTNDGVIRVFHDNDSLNRDGTVIEGLRLLSEANRTVWHNGYGYDIPLINKLYPDINIKGRIHDTYILGQMLFSNDMSYFGLAKWGEKFGIPKPLHEDWSKLSEDMIHRNKEDVKITSILWGKCVDKIRKSDLDVKEAVELEYEVYNIYKKSEDLGWCFDVHKSQRIIKQLEKCKELIHDRIRKKFPLIVKPIREINKITKKDGSLTQNVINATKDWNECTIGGPFTLVDIEEINLNSSSQLQKSLLGMGWVPEEWNYKKDPQGKPIKDCEGEYIKTTPKLSDSQFIGIDKEIGDNLRKYNLIKHRLGVIKGWYSSIKSGNCPIFAYTCGTNTARWRHRGLVNVPKADRSVYLGRQMRSLFKVPNGYKLVGCDASQLEARVEGSLTYKYDGGEYARFILSGDIHTFNSEIFGCDRNMAKNAGYCLAYGGGPGKLASILGCDLKKAQQLHKDYWEARPAAKQLKEDLENYVLLQGYDKRDSLYTSDAFIRSIDNRPIYVRSWHSLVNSMIQSTGMIIMKKAYVFLQNYITENNIPAIIIMLYHDEFQTIVKSGFEEEIAEASIRSIALAGEHFNMELPFEAESKIGNNWKETH